MILRTCRPGHLGSATASGRHYLGDAVGWDAIGTIGQKIGLFAILVLVAFVISKLVARFLADVTTWSNETPRKRVTARMLELAAMIR